MIYFVGVIISFFLAFILISKKNKSGADNILAVWLLFIGLHLLLFYLFIGKRYIGFPYLLGFELPMPLVHGPFLYLYCAALTGQHYKKRLRLLHFLPFILSYIPFLGFFLLPFSSKILVYQNKGDGYVDILSVLYILFIASGVLYITVSFRLLARHKKNIANQFSYTERINLAWLRYLLAGIMVIWAVIILGNDEAVYTTVVLYVLFIGYFGIKQVGVFTHQNPVTLTAQPILTEAAGTAIDEVLTYEAKDEIGKYTKSGLGEAAANNIHTQLTQAMETHQWYKNPELSLSKLSQSIGVQPNQLSQVINTKEQKNFYDYINQLRVNEFRQAVAQPQNQKFTLLALAYECGFNSKASFNRNFKKATGQSPTEYLKRSNISLSGK
jgi:AraC-like DNA-binding protein